MSSEFLISSVIFFSSKVFLLAWVLQETEAKNGIRHIRILLGCMPEIENGNGIGKDEDSS